MNWLKRNPGESDVAYLKRNAYYQRIVVPRLEYGAKSLQKKSAHVKPIDARQKDAIEKFWAPFTANPEDIVEFGWYDVYNAICPDLRKLQRYVPDTFYYAFVDEYFSNPQCSNPCDDKNLYDLYFFDALCPKTVFHKIGGLFLDGNYSQITEKEAIARIRLHDEVVLKVSRCSSCGKGLLFWSRRNGSEEELHDFIEKNDQLICQESIRQHRDLSRLHPGSINTIRMTTLWFDNKVHVLSSVLRMGMNNSRTDNASAGGIFCGIHDDGRLKSMAYDQMANAYGCHPQGVDFRGLVVPSFQAIVDTAVFLSKRLTSVSRLISWDFAVAENGSPVLIESNLSFGGVDHHQLCNGPIFGDLTEKVLEEVFANSYTLRCYLS